MKFTISQKNNPQNASSFDTSQYPGVKAISIGRSSGCVVSLKKQFWVNSSVGRTHFSLVRSADLWVATASSEKHALLQDGAPVCRIELLSQGCQFQFGNCLFTLDALDIDLKSPSSNFTLKVIEGASTRLFPIPHDGTISIGRDGSESDVILQTPYCSRTHALLRNKGKELFLEDVSTNGTKINNHVLKNETRQLKVGQEFEIDTANFQIISLGKNHNQFKVVQVILILLVGMVGIFLALPKEHEPPITPSVIPNGGTPNNPLDQNMNVLKLEKILGSSETSDFLVKCALKNENIESMSEQEYSDMLSDARSWKNLQGHLQELLKSKIRLHDRLNDNWPVETKHVDFPDFSMVQSSIDQLHCITLKKHLQEEFSELAASFTKLRGLSRMLQQAHQFDRQRALDVFQKQLQEISNEDDIDKTKMAWQQLEAAEKVLIVDRKLSKIQQDFQEGIVASYNNDTKNELIKFLDLMSSMPDFSEKSKYIDETKKLLDVYHIFEKLSKIDFFRMEASTIREFDLEKNKALGLGFLWIEKLAREKFDACLLSFDMYIAANIDRKDDLTLRDIEKAQAILNCLHNLTANIEGAGQRKQEIDFALRKLVEGWKQIINNRLVQMQKDYLSNPMQNHNLLVEMLPLAEPNSRWHSWITKYQNQHNGAH
jgi:hypothetical protein